MTKLNPALLVGVLLGAVSCGDSPIGVSNVSPGGSVGGLVLDAATLKPMAGVGVSVIAGARQFPPEGTAQTDASGRFAVDGLPAGALLIQVKPPASHFGVTITKELPNEAGDFPLANAILSLEIGLFPIVMPEAAFRVQLVTADGAAAANVKAHLRTQVAWVELGTGNPVGVGNAFVEATSDGTGALRFAGMPDVVKAAAMAGSGANAISDTVRVIIPPFDRDKDGALDFLGKEQSFSLLRLAGAVPTIVLSGAAAPALQVVASNIAAMVGRSGNRVLPATNGPLLLTFNWPVLEKLTEVTVFDERGGPLPAAPKPKFSGSLLTVLFEGLQDGNEYNVNVRGVASVEGALVEGRFGAPVFTPVKTGKVVVAGLKRLAPSRVQITFSEPIGPGVAGQAVTGALFFAADLNASNSVGDGPGERGYPASNLVLNADEVAPPGAAGRSGLSRYWIFDLPLEGTNPVPAGTGFELAFSRMETGIVQRADGSAVPDILNQTVP